MAETKLYSHPVVKEQCKNCPWRPEIQEGMSKEVKAAFDDTLKHEEYVCHETAVNAEHDWQICRGFHNTKQNAQK